MNQKTETLIDNLINCLSQPYEEAHREADRLLLEYIGHPGVKEAFEAVERGYLLKGDEGDN